MTYKNPRLKHVKKIKEIIKQGHIFDDDVKEIIAQCNLLLETKKKKRCERCAKGFTCYSHGAYPVRPESSPQPEKKSAGALVTDCCGTEDFDPWGFDRGDGTYDERCGKCGKKTDVNWKEYPKVESSPQPNKCDLHRTLDCPYCFAPQPEINKKTVWINTIQEVAENPSKWLALPELWRNDKYACVYNANREKVVIKINKEK